MSNVYFCSDLHLGHKGITKYRTEFASAQKHHDYMFRRLQNVGQNKNTVIHMLGDIAFTPEWLEALQEIPARLFLYRGNHCGEHMSFKTWNELAYKAFEQIHGIYKRYGSWLSHAPIHPNELRGKSNLHGHVHNKTISDPRYINICPEAWDYYRGDDMPDLARIRSIINMRGLDEKDKPSSET